VPDVRGLSIDDARQKLQDAGFRVKVRSLRIGDVFAQSPGAGSQREQGSTVTIYGI
jgi:beta-lactam-binding protein with PASTA domain